MRTLIFVLLLVGPGLAAADAVDDPLLAVTRIYTGDDGLTHFADGAIALEQQDFAPPSPTVALSKHLPTKGLAFVAMPPGWFGDWHPAPRKQYVLMLRGTFEIETGDGEKRRVAAGSAMLVEDTEGQGHRTRVVSDEGVLVAVVPADP